MMANNAILMVQLNVQVMDEEDRLRFGFDLMDPTKLVPEEYAPLMPIGKMTLNRNPINYFAETEQVMVRNATRAVDLARVDC